MLRSIFYSSVFIGLATMVYLYFFTFDDHSETELVRLSYQWFPFIAFGLAGFGGEKRYRNGQMGWLRKPIWFALFWMALSTLGLAFFLEGIFPSL
jgi:hypothetical protein